MHVTDAMAGEKLIRQFPRTSEEENDRCEKLRVPIQELVQKVSDNIPKRAPIIDCRLAALRAPMSAQLCSAIFAMRERLMLRSSSAEKSSDRKSTRLTPVTQ